MGRESPLTDKTRECEMVESDMIWDFAFMGLLMLDFTDLRNSDLTFRDLVNLINFLFEVKMGVDY